MRPNWWTFSQTLFFFLPTFLTGWIQLELKYKTLFNEVYMRFSSLCPDFFLLYASRSEELVINSSTWDLLIKANAWQLMNKWMDAWQTAVIWMETGIKFVSSVPSNSSNEYTSHSKQRLAFSSRPIVGLADCVNCYTPEFVLLFSCTLLGFF